jgi:hypothetical protein
MQVEINRDRVSGQSRSFFWGSISKSSNTAGGRADTGWRFIKHGNRCFGKMISVYQPARKKPT